MHNPEELGSRYDHRIGTTLNYCGSHKQCNDIYCQLEYYQYELRKLGAYMSHS